MKNMTAEKFWNGHMTFEGHTHTLRKVSHALDWAGKTWDQLSDEVRADLVARWEFDGDRK